MLSDSVTGVPATLMVLRVEIAFERMKVPSSIASDLAGLSEKADESSVSIEMGDAT